MSSISTNREDYDERLSTGIGRDIERTFIRRKIAMAEEYKVVWPRGKRDVKDIPYARHLDTLKGKTICELSDRAFHADDIFPMIEKELAKRYPGVKFVNYEKFGNTHGGGEANVIASLPDKLKQNRCDAVISGIGC